MLDIYWSTGLKTKNLAFEILRLFGRLVDIYCVFFLQVQKVVVFLLPPIPRKTFFFFFLLRFHPKRNSKKGKNTICEISKESWRKRFKFSLLVFPCPCIPRILYQTFRLARLALKGHKAESTYSIRPIQLDRFFSSSSFLLPLPF